MQLKNYKDKADEVDPPKGGEQKVVLELDDVVEKPDNDLLTKDATQEMRNGIVGKKVNTTGGFNKINMINSGPSSVPEKGILLTLVIFLKLLKCIDETIIRALMKKTEEIKA